MTSRVSTVIDVDGTIIDTSLRLQAIWKELLGVVVPENELFLHDHVSIFTKYSDDNQKCRADHIREKFWEILLCENDTGARLTKLDRAIPCAPSVVRRWSRETSIIYLTGRPETTRAITQDQLRRFRFPVKQTLLVMYSSADYSRADGGPSAESLASVRTRLFTSLVRQHNVVRVVDDKPANFEIYRTRAVPERIGMRGAGRFSVRDYLEKGATRVVDTWSGLV